MHSGGKDAVILPFSQRQHKKTLIGFNVADDQCMYVYFCVSDQWGKSKNWFSCDRDRLRAGTLPSVLCLICMHRWHSISIVIMKKAERTNRRYLAADTRGPITSIRPHSPLLRGFLISQPCALLCSAQWAYLQTVSLFRAGDRSVCVCVCVCVCE